MTDSAEIVDQNLIGAFEYFGLHKKQIETTKYYLIHTGCNHPLWNMIILPNKVDISQMDRMEEVFRLNNLPFGWWIDKKNLSIEMLNRFQNGKYTDCGDIPGMVYEIQNYQEQPFVIQNIKIISEINEFKKWIQVLAQNFEFGDDVCNLYLNKLSRFIGDNKIFIPLAVYEGNKIIATSSIIFVNGVAGFYDDATMPEYRNRGIASSLYQARFKILKKLGVDKAVIQTSSMATNLAQKLGFQKVVSYRMFYHTT